MKNNNKKKSDYLTYIEETRKHHKKLKKTAADATRKARKIAFSHNNYITYLENNQIIKEYPDGRKRVIKRIPNSVVKANNSE